MQLKWILGALLIAALPVATVIHLSGPRDDDSGGKAEETGSAKPSPGESSSEGESRDWAVFRGDARLTGFRDVAVGAKPALKWTFDTKSNIESTAAIIGHRVFVGTLDGFLLALELDSKTKAGKEIWRFEAEAGIKSSPSFLDGRLYFGDEFGFFYCLDAATGKKVWSLDTEGSEIISSASFYKGQVIFGGYDSMLYCLKAATGKVVWKIETGGPIHSTPAIVQGKTFVTGCDEVMHVIDIDKGKEIAQMELSSYTSASPVVEGDNLYVGTFGNEVLALDWKKGELLWRYKHPSRSFPFVSSAALTRDRLVLGGRDKSIHCIDRKTGKSVWMHPTKAGVECSPIIARDRVICGSSDKNLYMLDLKTGKLLWTFESDGAFLASPALASGRLVISSDNGLVYCFEVNP